MSNKIVTLRDVHNNRSEVSADQLEFRPSVYGVIISGDSILLSSTFDGWDFPGGGIEVWETIDEALEREVREETGVQIQRGALVHVQEDFYLSMKGQPLQSVLIFYKCEYAGGDISTDAFSESERAYMGKAQWLPLSSIEQCKFYTPVDVASVIRKATLL